MSLIQFNNNEGAALLTDVVKLRRGDGTYYDVPIAQLLGQCAAKREIHVYANGDSNTISDNTPYHIANPAGTIAGATITLPANPFDGQLQSLSTTHTITALTLNANTNQTLIGAATTLTAAAPVGYVYDAATATWYPAAI